MYVDKTFGTEFEILKSKLMDKNWKHITHLTRFRMVNCDIDIFK